MKSIDLKSYGPVISDKEVGDLIYKLIKDAVNKSEPVQIDLANIKSMATYCAKQIFGNLYVDLGPSKFFEFIQLKNANNDIKTIINIGIQHTLESGKSN